MYCGSQPDRRMHCEYVSLTVATIDQDITPDENAEL